MILTATSVAALFAMMPITPVIGGVTAIANGRRPANPRRYEYLGQCDRLRRGSPAGERAWQEMMAKATPIARRAWLAKVDLTPLLDEDETPDEWLSGHEAPVFRVSVWDGCKAAFLQTAGGITELPRFSGRVVLESFPAGRPDEPPRGGFDTDEPPWAGTVEASVKGNGLGDFARVRARRVHGDPFFQVKSAWATADWGPFAYDLVMERVTELGYGLTCDQQYVSPEAKRVWKVYAKRPDVARVARPRGVKGDVYQQPPVLLDALRALGEPVFREADLTR